MTSGRPDGCSSHVRQCLRAANNPLAQPNRRTAPDQVESVDDVSNASEGSTVFNPIQRLAQQAMSLHGFPRLRYR
jgi:hypothetical protein